MTHEAPTGASTTKAEPGSRRFREVIRREREDMAWLVHVVAAMYDEISGGAISNPMTYPSEVVGVFNERLMNAANEAAVEARATVLAELRTAVEGLRSDPSDMSGGTYFMGLRGGGNVIINRLLALIDGLAKPEAQP